MAGKPKPVSGDELSPHGILSLPGAAALSLIRRAKLLMDARARVPNVAQIYAQYWHFASLAAGLDASERAVLDRLLAYGPQSDPERPEGFDGASGTRLLVVGDPAFDLDERLERPGVEWLLGYRTNVELDDALARSTVAVFPYREELDQSGALLRALGAGVPAAAYDVGGIAEPVRRYGAGVVAPPDDLDGLAEGVRRLLEDPAALESARAGARQASSELTWDAAAASHLALYEELVQR